jgi:hypothetical protein
MARRTGYGSIAAMSMRRRARPTEQRRLERLIRGPGHMAGLVAGDERHVVRLYDLTHAGAMIAMPFALAAGDRVSLMLGGGVNLRAELRWVDGGRAGLVFLTR